MVGLKLDAAIQLIEMELFRIDSWRRYTNGLCHEVYEIKTIDQHQYVLRITPVENEAFLLGGIELSKMFNQLIPIPQIIYSCIRDDLKFVVQSKIGGLDLSQCYGEVSKLNKLQIAKQAMEIQWVVNQNISTSKFGFGIVDDDFEFEGCTDFLWNRLNTFQSIIPAEWHSVMSANLHQLDDHFKKRPSCVFIDDLTLKNIIVKDELLAGVIDIDWLFSGDILFFIGKVYSECVMNGYDYIFPDALFAIVKSETPRSVLDAYINLCCFEILSWQHKSTANGNAISDDLYRRIETYLRNYFAHSNSGITDV